MKKWFRKQGGFTFIEMAVTFGMAAFSLIGFVYLWAQIAKQEAISSRENIVDGYGNFLIYRIAQDLKNAYDYRLTGRLYGLDGIECRIVNYTNVLPETLIVRWQLFPNGDAERRQMGRNQITERMFREYGAVLQRLKPEESIRASKFLIKPAGSLYLRQRDYALLDSSAVQIELALDYTKQPTRLTSFDGPEGRIQEPYMRRFQWQTMLYLKNKHIYKLKRFAEEAAGQ
ncbi:MAG: hypothetical protein N2450_00910 [bacterium]|nr:hypothetical protein [bacterium]